MKKYFRAYGSLVLYLTIAFALDRVRYETSLWQANEFWFYHHWEMIGAYYLIFSITSLAFIYLAFKISGEDWIYHIFQLILGSWWISILAFQLGAYLRFFPFDLLSKLNEIGVSPYGTFSIALNFIAVLGVMGLLRKNGNDETVS